MVLNGFDSVKPISMGNYGGRRKLKWLFEFFMFLFLVFHRSSLFSLAGPALRRFSQRLLAVLNSHIFVFVVFHAMLFVVYSLSHLTDNKSGSNPTDAESGLDGRSSHVTADDSPQSVVAPRDDSVDEILVVGENNTASAPERLAAPVDDPVAEILVIAEKNTAKPPVNRGSTDATSVTETTRAPTPGSPVLHLNSVTASKEITPEASGSPVLHLNSVTASTDIPPETRQYRRTESSRFEENRERGKLRRSKTEIHREDGEEPANFLNSVDEMDIDDFNRKVESFIAEQKLHIGGRISG